MLLISGLRFFKDIEKKVLNLNNDLIAEWGVTEFSIYLLQPLLKAFKKSWDRTRNIELHIQIRIRNCFLGNPEENVSFNKMQITV